MSEKNFGTPISASGTQSSELLRASKEKHENPNSQVQFCAPRKGPICATKFASLNLRICQEQIGPSLGAQIGLVNWGFPCFIPCSLSPKRLSCCTRSDNVGDAMKNARRGFMTISGALIEPGGQKWGPKSDPPGSTNILGGTVSGTSHLPPGEKRMAVISA